MLYLNHTKGGRGSSPNKGVGAAVVGEGWVDQIPPYQATSGGAAMTIQQKNSRKGATKTNRTGSSWMERVLAWAPSLPGRGLAISSCPGGWLGYVMEPWRSTEQTRAHTGLYPAAVPCCHTPSLSLPDVNKAFSAPTACDPC